jgi:hypothetical protein
MKTRPHLVTSQDKITGSSWLVFANTQISHKVFAGTSRRMQNLCGCRPSEKSQLLPVQVHLISCSRLQRLQGIVFMLYDLPEEGGHISGPLLIQDAHYPMASVVLLWCCSSIFVETSTPKNEKLYSVHACLVNNNNCNRRLENFVWPNIQIISLPLLHNYYTCWHGTKDTIRLHSPLEKYTDCPPLCESWTLILVLEQVWWRH